VGNNERYFFIHVMKTAGTALAFDLKAQFSIQTVYPCRGIDWTTAGDEAYRDVDRLLALPPERHAAIDVYTGHFPYWVCEWLGVDVATFTVLREPVARTISVLKHFKRLPKYADMPLEAIYEDGYIFRFFVQNHQAKVFALTPDDPHTVMCGLNFDDAALERALANLSNVGVLGITEEYPAFIRALQTRFHWWHDGVNTSPRVNVSTEDWDASPEFRRRIADDNRYDMEFYERARELIS
jgi:hypothetical protein